MVTKLLHGDLHIEKKHNSNRQSMNVIDQLFKKSYLNMILFFEKTYCICIQEISKYQGVIESNILEQI